MPVAHAPRAGEHPRMDEHTQDSQAPSLADWRARVERDLKGADFDKRLLRQTDDGVPVKPLYTGADAARSPVRSGAGWTPLTIARHPDPRVSNAQIKADLAQGARAVVLDLEGLTLVDGADVDAVLDGVDAPVHLIGGHLLHALACSARPQTQSLGLDPIGHLARTGAVSVNALELSARLALEATSARVFEVDTRGFHRAGAGETQCIGYALATGVAYLGALLDAGLSVDQAAARIGFTVNVGVRFFESIAALRALRLAWTRVIEASGGANAAMRIRAWPALRQTTRRDPSVNMLRNTAAVFAGAVGGADEVVSLPFDVALGQPSDRGRRIARNTQTILAQESHLAQVADPAGGSWFLETLTRQIADEAWRVFQEVEAGGGMMAGLVTGRVQRAIVDVAHARALRIARRKQPITGVSAFADSDALLAAEPVDQAGLDAWRATRATPTVTVHAGDLAQAARHIAVGARFDDLARAVDDGRLVGAQALPIRRDAAPFEALRAYADALPARPTVFLANLGPLARHLPRATFATNLLLAGGVEALTNEGFEAPGAAAAAFAASGASIACVCGHEDDYAQAPALIDALRAAGAQRILMAGRPRTLPGVDDYVYLGCDAIAVLRSLMPAT